MTPRATLPRQAITSGSSFSVGIGSLNQYDMLVPLIAKAQGGNPLVTNPGTAATAPAVMVC